MSLWLITRFAIQMENEISSKSTYRLLYRVKPFLAVTFLQFGFAGMDVFSKVALNQGVSNYVLVVYRHAIATAVIAPFAVILDKSLSLSLSLSLTHTHTHTHKNTYSLTHIHRFIIFFISSPPHPPSISAASSVVLAPVEENWIQNSFFQQESTTKDDFLNLHQTNAAQLIGVIFRNKWIICLLLSSHIKTIWASLSPLSRPVIDQNLYYFGLKYTTATFAAAMYNILPAITFLMACIFG